MSATPGPILVIGGQGQLAAALADAAAADGTELLRAARPEVDFDRPESLDAAIDRVAPSLVVNAAAYTAVDAAEADAAAAFRANRDGPARLAARARVPLIHVSTDYVFDGLKGAPYVETDPVCPQGVYGTSKCEGEAAVLAAAAQAVVLRTSWVYAPRGKNFVLTMLNAARRNNRLRVVADQKGCPTAAADLARCILDIAALIRRTGWQPAYGGVFHAAGSGWTTWHGLALEVFHNAARHGRPFPEVEAIATADWPTPARRPPDSRLDCGKLQAVFGLRLPDWRRSVAATVDAVVSESG